MDCSQAVLPAKMACKAHRDFKMIGKTYSWLERYGRSGSKSSCWQMLCPKHARSGSGRRYPTEGGRITISFGLTCHIILVKHVRRCAMLDKGRMVPPDGVEAATQPCNLPGLWEAFVAKLAHETK